MDKVSFDEWKRNAKRYRGKRIDIEGLNDEQIAWVIHAVRQISRTP